MRAFALIGTEVERFTSRCVRSEQTDQNRAAGLESYRGGGLLFLVDIGGLADLVSDQTRVTGSALEVCAPRAPLPPTHNHR